MKPGGILGTFSAVSEWDGVDLSLLPSPNLKRVSQSRLKKVWNLKCPVVTWRKDLVETNSVMVILSMPTWPNCFPQNFCWSKFEIWLSACFPLLMNSRQIVEYGSFQNRGVGMPVPSQPLFGHTQGVLTCLYCLESQQVIHFFWAGQTVRGKCKPALC